jgi:hypothetical protein
MMNEKRNPREGWPLWLRVTDTAATLLFWTAALLVAIPMMVVPVGAFARLLWNGFEAGWYGIGKLLGF